MDYDIIEILELFEDYENNMQKTVNGYATQLLNIRAGRANPHLLDRISIVAYGVDTPLKAVANIVVAEARLIVISVWDPSLLKTVEKAIIDSNIGITPNNDGKVIRLIFPELTQERRLALVKEIKQGCEASKVQLRNSRRDANDACKKLKKDNIITEDDEKDILKDIDKKLNEFIAKIDTMSKDKETEVTSV